MTLDKLLYILCEKGWNPYGIPRVKNVVTLNHCICFSKRTIFGIEFFEYSLRSLVSKESGLWQFCEENKLVKLIENPNENKCPRDRMSEEEYRIWEYNVYYSFSNKKDIHKRYEQNSSTYRIIESALCDEDKLEKFLLDNIKIDGE